MNGIILVDKPRGVISSKVVAMVKKVTKENCGHLGTLDPLAEGVLPICIGRATRLFDYFLKKKKEYVAWFSFGQETDTLDLEGQVIKEISLIPTREMLERAISNQFLGEQKQLPPIYSSKKVDGLRAYDMARKNKEIDLKEVDICIYAFEFIKQIDDNTFEFRIECSAGTYIRALARDLANSVGSCATMTKLVRTKVGDFELKDCIPFDQISIDLVEKKFFPIKSIFTSMPQNSITISRENLKNLLNGKNSLLTKCPNSEIVKVYCEGEVVGLGITNAQGYLKIKTYLL